MPCSSSTSIPIRNCSMSNGAELQSMPISSPTLPASSALKLVTPVRSVTGIDEAVVSALRMMATARETDRVRALVETGIAINFELSLDGVLERIIEAAARLTGGQYAALGVMDRSGGWAGCVGSQVVG